MDEFSRKRIDNLTHTSELSVKDMLKAVLHDIETGVVKPDRAMLFMVTEGEGGDYESLTWRANMTTRQELSFMAIRQHGVIKDFTRKG